MRKKAKKNQPKRCYLTEFFNFKWNFTLSFQNFFLFLMLFSSLFVHSILKNEIVFNNASNIRHKDFRPLSSPVRLVAVCNAMPWGRVMWQDYRPSSSDHPHLFFNITGKGQMIVPDWYNWILDYTKKDGKNKGFQWT